MKACVLALHREAKQDTKQQKNISARKQLFSQSKSKKPKTNISSPVCFLLLLISKIAN